MDCIIFTLSLEIDLLCQLYQWSDIDLGVILNDSQFLIDSFRQQQPVRCLDLHINCSTHFPVFKANVNFHLSIQDNRLLVVIESSFIGRFKILLLQPGVLTTVLNKSPLTILMFEPVSIIPVTGTPSISTVTLRGLPSSP